MALEGQVHISESYLDRVHLVGYPMTSTDASIKISELRSSDTGVYRCEVQHGIEDNHDIVHVQVQGMQKSCQRSVTSVSHNITEATVLDTTDLNIQEKKFFICFLIFHMVFL